MAEVKKPGRPPFVPTEEHRGMVTELAALGTRHEDICRFIKWPDGRCISQDTLKRCFAVELEFGRAEANAKVAATLFKMATSGDQPAATFFWLKTRAGWRETPQQVAFTDPDGNPAPAPSLADFYKTVQVVKGTKPEGEGAGTSVPA
jgi:hypothetical protein